MGITIAHRARAIRTSPTLAVSAMAREMKAHGIDVINFGVGEPDFNTPEYIKTAAKNAIDANFTRYTNANGIIELRKAIVAKLKKDNNLSYDVDQILVSPGAKASIVNILMTVCDPRDEVLIPSPYWVSYTSQVELVDAFPVLLPTTAATGFKITAEQIETTLRTLSNPKCLILNSPNNPTGSVYAQQELEALAEVCAKHNLLIISDEIYEKLIYDDTRHFSIASASPEAYENTIVINGVSKAYAMTGWRLGYAAGAKEIIRRACQIQGHVASCVNSISQKAAVIALSEDDGSIERMRQEFERRRTYLVNEFNQLPHIKCMMPLGAFYAIPDISYYLKHNSQNVETSVDFCQFMLKEHHIAIVPGAAFGIDDYVRFSYATSVENIKEGLNRFRAGLEHLAHD
jgi:aspartate aminotransferase